eukprot:g11876.t1
MAEVREVLVRVTTMTGQETEVTIDAAETMFMLRQKVGQLMGIPMWKLKLLHGTEVVKKGPVEEPRILVQNVIVFMLKCFHHVKGTIE